MQELAGSWALIRICGFAAGAVAVAVCWLTGWMAAEVRLLAVLLPWLMRGAVLGYAAFLLLGTAWHVMEVLPPHSLCNVEDDYTSQLRPTPETYLIPPICLLPHDRVDQLLFSAESPRL